MKAHSWPRRTGAVLTLGAAVLASPVLAEVVNLPSVADTTLLEVNPDNNMGGEPHVHAGTTAISTRNRALIKFNPASAIPSNAVITSATLTLQVTMTPPAGGVNSTFGLHRVLVDWGEGDKIGLRGSLASAGEATWFYRFLPTDTWAEGGALADTDFVATSSASTFVAGLGSYTFSGTPALAADVQFWLNNPAGNFGWMLLCQDEETGQTARRFGSRENAAAPVLTVSYFVPPPPPPAPLIEAVQLAGGELQFQFLAHAGFGYTVEQRGSFTLPGWETFAEYPAVPSNRTIIVSVPVTNSAQFFQVRRE
jgi:hypothetical protein